MDDLQKMRKKADEHFKEVINEFLSKPFIDCRSSEHRHGKNSLMAMSMITTLVKMKTDEIRDELVKIRVLMDENPMKAKQLTTNLIKELK